MDMKFNWILTERCMVISMNKTEFIKQLASNLSYSEDKCIIINDILESNFFISKKNKDKIIDELKQKLDVDKKEAERIYDIAVTLVKSEIKKQIKHPFKGKNNS